MAVFDFTEEQYFSLIRAPRVLLRRARGELANNSVRHLTDFRTPVEYELRRVESGTGGSMGLRTLSESPLPISGTIVIRISRLAFRMMSLLSQRFSKIWEATYAAEPHSIHYRKAARISIFPL